MNWFQIVWSEKYLPISQDLANTDMAKNLDLNDDILRKFGGQFSIFSNYMRPLKRALNLVLEDVSLVTNFPAKLCFHCTMEMGVSHQN